MLEASDLYPQFAPLVADLPLNAAPTTTASNKIAVPSAAPTVSPVAVATTVITAAPATDSQSTTNVDQKSPVSAATITAPAPQALSAASSATATVATTVTHASGVDSSTGTASPDASATSSEALVVLPTSAHVRARSLASLQLRAKNAMRALLQQRKEHMLVLCASSSIDTINTAVDLVREVGGPEPTVAYAPTKFELFGNDKEDGLVTICPHDKLNIVIMPCVHLVDHPKWLGMLEACLGQNMSLKLILTGDATDIAQLSMIWPVADNALHTDIVLEFSSLGALNTIAGLISYYAQQQQIEMAALSQAEQELSASTATGEITVTPDTNNASDAPSPSRESVDGLKLELEANRKGTTTTTTTTDVQPLLPFTSEALTLLANYCCRLSGDRRYLGLPECTLQALIFAANSYAHQAQSDLVQRYHVLKALGAHDFRNNFLSESSLREHRDRQLLIATSGAVIGQINGLSVIETLGTCYEFGEPVRITATLRAGGEGDVIDIERKAELAGQIHAKAMMIINGFLTKEFGAEQPLPVSASLVFEQSYSEVDGDSASLTGLCAVISVLAGVPIRQDLAVTGAVDQFGDVQAVGGVNEKIEGFYRVCRLHGFTGTQGVVIPRSCVQQLVLRPAVVKAVADGKFHIFTVDHVTEAVKLLTSVDWGDSNTAGSIRYRIGERLNNIVNNNSNEDSWFAIGWQKLKELFSGNSEANANTTKEHKA